MADPPVLFPRNAPVVAPVAVAPGTPPPLPSGGLWAERRGDDLLVQSDALLPEVCVKCGRRDGLIRRNQSFVYVPRWVYLLLLVNVIVCAVVSMVMQRRGRLQVPICRACNARWRNGNLFLGLSIAWLFAGLILGAVWLSTDNPIPGALSLLTALGAPVAASIAARRRSLRPRLIKDLLMTLSGFHPDAADAAVQASMKPAAQLPGLAPDGSIAR